MLLPEHNENVVDEYDDVVHHPDDTSDKIEGDLPLEKLLKLSKVFKTGIEKDLNTFMEEKITMINEMSGISYITTPNEKSIEITEIREKPLLFKHEGDYNDLFSRDNSETIRNLKQELLQNVQGSSNINHNGNEFKLEQEKVEFSTGMMSSLQNKISELYHMLNINQSIEGKSNNLKKILEVENKCQYWMDKYDELNEKYLRLESKYVNVEKENCSYLMEIARVKMIEDENLRLNQTIDKSNHVRKELESALESCHRVISNYQTDAEVARNKVKEAVEVVDKTYSEKERLATDLKIANEEIEKLKNELKTLIQEAGKKVNLEVEKVKTMYKDKLHQTSVEIEFLRTESQIAGNKIKQLEQENGILNQKYTSINQKYMNELDVYSKKVASKVLEVEEHEVISGKLIADIETLKGTNRKLQESYVRKKNKYAMEIEFLKDTTKTLEDNLNKALNEIANDNKNIVEATNTIKILELEIIKLKRPENNLNEKNKQINEIVEVHKQTINM
ncbi:Hypothetical protein CINCED_3A004784 [Cinara cedri]|uniref:Uncharacterized protein n=1 Tax=Cinara cedri TaxID=506608 RepID=A0A5E4MSW7_9HEMI|nr:Hypothetical protein CINCED_3A004784 [Cinara cedri]